MGLYKLIVVTTQGTFDVIEDESELRPVLNDWVEHGDEVPGGSECLVVRGMVDNYQRDPITHGVCRLLIVGMSLIPWP